MEADFDFNADKNHRIPLGHGFNENKLVSVFVFLAFRFCIFKQSSYDFNLI